MVCKLSFCQKQLFLQKVSVVLENQSKDHSTHTNADYYREQRNFGIMQQNSSMELVMHVSYQRDFSQLVSKI